MDVMQQITDDTRDFGADEIIQSCFDLNRPKSFFLFAGAGSGKTKSLVAGLNYINATIGRTLKLNGRKVAVITYTNAARDEIERRAQYNTLFEISTIHSFAWNLISSHTSDIKAWLANEISSKIAENELKQAASKKTTTKAYKDREKKLIKYKKRLEHLDTVKSFIYNPDGINIEHNSLDHAEVIKITADLLARNSTLQQILVDKYPILLIDESQDTKKELMNVFLQIQEKYSERFSLGLLGDTMQRIYLDGKEDLHSSIPESWEKPRKIMNHRSQKRIVELCNNIRRYADGIQQKHREDKPLGVVRMFITESSDPYSTEHKVRIRMAEATQDQKWQEVAEVKNLTVEHKMAASRLGFSTFFEPLNAISSYKQGLMNGTLSPIGLFTHILIPLHAADITNDPYEKMRIVRDNALLFQDKNSTLSTDLLEHISTALNLISECWNSHDPTCKELLDIVYENNVFPIHKDLKLLIENPPSADDEEHTKYSNLNQALAAKFSEVEQYYKYITGNASFDTHQGVKGLEFDRVMVIIDDQSTKGTTFSYNKLFGVEEKSETDIQNEHDGKETTLDRTRRLLYVTCSRAKESLAIVYYAPSADAALRAVKDTGWFSKEEIVVI